ncbi:MAG TPA: nucleoside triphosphate pyrophosphohydrolase [Anaerolineae bacterium]|nr:nucleoside triphosphate pyrophosphohydrolase [Anaerolineae bacterium]
MGITIVGLGPGDGRFLTREAWKILAGAEKVYLRTMRHPAAADLPAGVAQVSFDDLYDTAVSFAAVYEQIVTQLLADGRSQNIIYAVPGHPFVGESTVTRLVQLAEVEGVPVRVVAGLSFVEPALTAVQADGLDGLQLFDAIELTQYLYPPLNPDYPALLGQVYSRLLAGELKLRLNRLYPDEHPVTLIHAAGNEDEVVEHIPLYAIDRSPQIDHLTSLYLPPLPQASSLAALAETVAVLRSPNGCPWDQEQTPQSMRAGFLEEAAEVMAALDANDPAELREELGDLLYHVVMQAQMAAEAEEFTLAQVIAGIEAKLKYRHPHVWGDWQVADSDEVVQNWEALKQTEKNRQPNSTLDNVPAALPALARSQKIQKRVSKVGFDWPDISGVYAKLDEEIRELKAAQTVAERADELGDVLFVLANVAKWLGVDAESALREANLKFTRRFQGVERLARQRDIDMTQLSLDELDVLWREVKNGG